MNIALSEQLTQLEQNVNARTDNFQTTLNSQFNEIFILMQKGADKKERRKQQYWAIS